MVWTVWDDTEPVKRAKSRMEPWFRHGAIQHILCDPSLPPINCSHMVHKEEFPGPEWKRSKSHVGFGSIDDPAHYRECVFCSCENQPDGAKTILVEYLWQNHSEQGECSMCGSECKSTDHSHFGCWNCGEVMCTRCHEEIDENVEIRKKVLQKRNK